MAVTTGYVAEERLADTALREAHEALAARADELLHANERLASFAATLSHDLLQPVTALDGFLSLLDRYADELTEEHRSWLHGALRGSVRISQVIEALHRDASTDELTLVPVALDEVIADLLVELPTGDDAVVIESGDLPTVLADHGVLAQVLVNLVQNALRYRADDRQPRVRLEARRDRATWVLVMTDTGRGIHPDELDAVFLQGFRGRSSSGTSGTGTGLATVRALARHMGGDAWAEQHDGGARLCVRLRAVESS